MKLLRKNNKNNSKGNTIIELIVVLGIMALISMIISLLLSFTIAFNNNVSASNDKEYKAHEFYRYVRNNIKSFRVSTVDIEESKVSIFYNEYPDHSDKIDILAQNQSVKIIYYNNVSGTYIRTVTRTILKDVINASFFEYRNILYVNLYWRDGERSLGVIDLK